MEHQTKNPKTLGQAIDELIGALSSIDEASRVTAIKAACDHLKLELFSRVSLPQQQSIIAADLPGEPPNRGHLTDVKSFRAEKQPTSANEMAALVAYYLVELVPDVERKAEVDTEDMVKFFKQAGFPLPKAPQMLLTNAKNAGYFDKGNAGGYRLNPVGHNLVAHNLPRANSSGAPVKRRKPRAAGIQKQKRRKA
jgi:hypothetical protein